MGKQKEKPGIAGKLKKIKRLYQVATFLIENEDIEFGIMSARAVSLRLRHFLDEWKSQSAHSKAFVEFFEGESLPSFDSDLKILEEMNLKLEKNGEVDKKEFLGIFNRQGDYLSKTENTFHLATGKQSWLRIFSLIKSEQMLKIFGAAVAACLLLYLFWYFGGKYHRKAHSLVGQFFNDEEFRSVSKTVNNSELNFSWGYGSPYLGLRADHFVARWTGFLDAPNEGSYLFQIRVDDGARLWIDNQLLIDDWTPQYWHVASATTTLSKGIHSIRVEYLQVDSEKGITLMWKPPLQKESRVIPSEAFYSEEKYLPILKGRK